MGNLMALRVNTCQGFRLGREFSRLYNKGEITRAMNCLHSQNCESIHGYFLFHVLIYWFIFIISVGVKVRTVVGCCY